MKNKLKWVLVIGLITVLAVPSYKAIQYYLDNQLYAHFVLNQWYQAKDSPIEDGYVDKQSYDWGDTCRVFINSTDVRSTWIKLYDINQQIVDSVWVQLQPQDAKENSSEEGFGYEQTLEYKIPELKGGLYLWEKKIPLLIRGDDTRIGVLYASNTRNAYNIFGGKSLYGMFSQKTNRVSFLRPTFPYISFQAFYGLRYFFNHQSFKFSYLSDLDMDRMESLENLDVLIIVGHSEYWARQARRNFDSFITNGGQAIILSGNTMWWQVRYSEKKDAMICYKSREDPIEDTLLRTINWSDALLNYPIGESIISDFMQGGYGRKNNIGFNGYKVINKPHPVFQDVLSEELDMLHIPSKEYDGVSIRYEDGAPVRINNSFFTETELLAYDSLGDSRNGAFVVGKKTDSTGMVYNVGTMDWCSGYGMGGTDSSKLQVITDRMIKLCLAESEKGTIPAD
ncbi:N,N-dimethylformamidase beta subunit family domain-containing protein [Reichenbachiella sp.]|uniref:N,N-dimethylformamidase beta subunit family domain-containing protein n=1 Tax=Reichenbachiella sp. TaxID=2184521 RepID=UPI003BB1C2C6